MLICAVNVHESVKGKGGFSASPAQLMRMLRDFFHGSTKIVFAKLLARNLPRTVYTICFFGNILCVHESVMSVMLGTKQRPHVNKAFNCVMLSCHGYKYHKRTIPFLSPNPLDFQSLPA